MNSEPVPIQNNYGDGTATPPNEIDTNQLEIFITDLKQEIELMSIENTVFLNYLKNNYTRGYEQAVKIFDKMAQAERRRNGSLSSNQSSMQGNERRHSKISKISGLTGYSASMYSSGGFGSTYSLRTFQKLNYTTKIGFIEFEIKLYKQNIQQILKENLKTIKSLTTKIHALEQTNAQVLQTANKFEIQINVNGRDPITHKIKSEVFAKFVNNYLNEEKLLIDSTRLKVTILEKSYLHKRNIYDGKVELSGILRPIDFEKLTIQKKTFQSQLEVKNIQLIELKQLTGRSALALTTQKKLLDERQRELNNLQNKIKSAKTVERNLDEEEEKAFKEIERTRSNIDSLTDYMKQYTAPKYLEYALCKEDLMKIKKQLKIAKRAEYIGHLKVDNLRDRKSVV